MRYIALVAVYLIWGSTYFAVKVFIEGGGVTPLQFQFARAVCAALLLAGVYLVLRIARWLGTRSRRFAAPATVSRPRSRRVAVGIVTVAGASGALMWASGNGFATLAAPHASSSFIVMAMGIIPLWSVVIEAVITRRLPRPIVLVGLGMGLIGLGLVVAPSISSAAIVEPAHVVPTVLLLGAGGFTWALGTAIQKRVAPQLTTTALSTLQFTGAVLVLVVPVAIEHAPIPPRIGTDQLLAFSYLVVFGSAVSLAAYAVVVRRFSPPVASTFAYVNPVVGLVLGAAFLHETVQPISLVGLCVVLAAVLLVMKSRDAGRTASGPAAGRLQVGRGREPGSLSSVPPDAGSASERPRLHPPTS